MGLLRLGLWRERAFGRLWSAVTVSAFGTQITALALPSVAILTLQATPFDVGILTALPWLAFVFFAPLSGVVSDRLPRRRVMIMADLGRAFALATLPLAFAFNILSMGQLYLIAIIVGILTVFFEAAYRSILPTLVSRSALFEGNSKLMLGQGAAELGGPVIGGTLIQLFSAANAIVVDCFSFLVCSFLLLFMPGEQEKPSRLALQTGRLWQEIGEGFRVVVCHPVMRPIMLINAITNFGASIVNSVALVFAYRLLHLTPDIVGIAFAIGSIGFVFGALLCGKLTRLVGMGRTLALANGLYGAGYLLLPLAIVLGPACLVIFTFWRILYGISEPLYSVNSTSLRQALTPEHLQSRVVSVVNTFGKGALGMGALLGGFLGNSVGIVPALVIGGVITISGTLPALGQQIRQMQDMDSIEKDYGNKAVEL